MPFIEVEEIPEGVEAADVVARADYDAIVAERDTTMQQRDDALTQIEEARKEVRDTKAKYADAILSANREPQEKVVQKKEHALTVDDLWRD